MADPQPPKVGRRSLLLATGAVLLARAGRAATADEPPPSLRSVQQPCSLRKVCAELARRFHARVTVEGPLADQRVVWSFQAGTPLETVLDRLACLTGARVLRQTSPDRRPAFALERLERTVRLEAAWRREGLL